MKRREHLGDLDIDWRIILKYVLKEQGVRMWAATSFLRKAVSCGLSRT
jgi:hypothetical protein